MEGEGWSNKSGVSENIPDSGKADQVIKNGTEANSAIMHGCPLDDEMATESHRQYAPAPSDQPSGRQLGQPDRVN